MIGPLILDLGGADSPQLSVKALRDVGMSVNQIGKLVRILGQVKELVGRGAVVDIFPVAPAHHKGAGPGAVAVIFREYHAFPIVIWNFLERLADPSAPWTLIISTDRPHLLPDGMRVENLQARRVRAEAV